MRRAGAGSPAVHAEMLVVLVVVTVALALAASQLWPGWATRYFAVVLGPMLLVGAAALATAGRVGLVGLLAIVVLWAAQPAPRISDADARTLAQRLSPVLEPGTLVLSPQPERVPVLHHYLPDGLRYATPLGPVADPRTMDWRDAVSRLQASASRGVLERTLASVPPGGSVALVRPISRSRTQWEAPWTRAIIARSRAWAASLRADPRFRPVARTPARVAERSTGIAGVVYERRPHRHRSGRGTDAHGAGSSR